MVMADVFLQGLTSYFYFGFFLFLPGFCLRLFLSQWIQGDGCVKRDWTNSLVESFILSMLVTSAMGILFGSVGFGLNIIKYWLSGFLIVGGLVYLLRRCRGFQQKKQNVRENTVAVNAGVLTVIAVVFVGMIFQGGLLDFLADGWWHLAYVSQMISDNSMFIEHYPTTGGTTASVIYPPFWHFQLALISEASAISPPILWHFVAPINVVVLLASFYQLTLELTRSKKTALIAVVLHIFLIGGLISYFRVSSWPGNVSYIALYFAFTLFFRLSSVQGVSGSRYSSVKKNLKDLWYVVFLLLGSICAMVGLHGVEVALFSLTLLSLWLCTGLFFSKTSSPSQIYADKKNSFIVILIMAGLGFALAVTIMKARYLFLVNSPPAYEPYLSLLIPLGIIVYISGYQWIMKVFGGSEKNNIIRNIYFIFLGLMLISVVDWPHLVELFIPVEDPTGRHVPRDYQGMLGNWLFLPFWEHQLRGAMLFSGVLSLVIGFTLVFIEKNRATLFIFATTSLVFLVIFSPYFFTLAAFIIPLASVYRVSLLLFAPLILAVAVSMLLAKGHAR